MAQRQYRPRAVLGGRLPGPYLPRFPGRAGMTSMRQRPPVQQDHRPIQPSRIITVTNTTNQGQIRQHLQPVVSSSTMSTNNTPRTVHQNPSTSNQTQGRSFLQQGLRQVPNSSNVGRPSDQGLVRQAQITARSTAAPSHGPQTLGPHGTPSAATATAASQSRGQQSLSELSKALLQASKTANSQPSFVIDRTGSRGLVQQTQKVARETPPSASHGQQSSIIDRTTNQSLAQQTTKATRTEKPSDDSHTSITDLTTSPSHPLQIPDKFKTRKQSTNQSLASYQCSESQAEVVVRKPDNIADQTGTPRRNGETASTALFSPLGGIKPAHVNLNFLSSNANIHNSLSAIAELIDNAYDPDASASHLEIDVTDINGVRCMIFQDDGNGMSPVTLHKMMSFGFSEKKESYGQEAIGRYGNGFKSSSMRLGKDAIVFTRDISGTKSVGMLSQSYLLASRAETVLVPLVTWDANNKVQDECASALEAVIMYSLFHTYNELLRQFDCMDGISGTRIIIWNLKMDDEERFELDFVSTEDDIIDSKPQDPDEQRLDRRATKEHIPKYKSSLREYISILYYKPRLQVTLRGKKVRTKRPTWNLTKKRTSKYSPSGGETVSVTFGFNKKNMEDSGMMLYHNNRLIEAYIRVGPQTKLDNPEAVGVVGVAEANYLEPMHTKQGFTDGKKYCTFISRMGVKLKLYWLEQTGQQVAKEEPARWTWVQCDKCSKWRRLTEVFEDDQLPEKWFCHMNNDLSYNRCDATEEKEDGDEEVVKLTENQARKRRKTGESSTGAQGSVKTEAASPTSSEHSFICIDSSHSSPEAMEDNFQGTDLLPEESASSQLQEAASTQLQREQASTRLQQEVAPHQTEELASRPLPERCVKPLNGSSNMITPEAVASTSNANLPQTSTRSGARSNRLPPSLEPNVDSRMIQKIVHQVFQDTQVNHDTQGPCQKRSLDSDQDDCAAKHLKTNHVQVGPVPTVKMEPTTEGRQTEGEGTGANPAEPANLTENADRGASVDDLRNLHAEVAELKESKVQLEQQNRDLSSRLEQSENKLSKVQNDISELQKDVYHLIKILLPDTQMEDSDEVGGILKEIIRVNKDD